MNAQSPQRSRPASDRVACRAITEIDLPQIAALLARGFPERSPAYWSRGLGRMAERDVPPDCPRFGYLLAVGDRIVGSLLLIVSDNGAVVNSLRANVSSWYVEPEYRSLASMLVSRAFSHKTFTFVNISPASHTVPILRAQGYAEYVAGQVICVPSLSFVGARATVSRFDAGRDGMMVTPYESALLERHAGYGCVSLICRRGDGVEPFVFARTRWKTNIPAAQLIWCREPSSFPSFAGSIGRWFLRRAIPIVVFDANGSVDVPGVYRAGRAPKFFRGGARPRVGDLADTELAILGP